MSIRLVFSFITLPANNVIKKAVILIPAIVNMLLIISNLRFLMPYNGLGYDFVAEKSAGFFSLSPKNSKNAGIFGRKFRRNEL